MSDNAPRFRFVTEPPNAGGGAPTENTNSPTQGGRGVSTEGADVPTGTSAGVSTNAEETPVAIDGDPATAAGPLGVVGTGGVQHSLPCPRYFVFPSIMTDNTPRFCLQSMQTVGRLPSVWASLA